MGWLEKFVTRKFVAATLTSMLMFGAWLLCQWLPAAREYFGTLVTGLVSGLTAYTAGNVVQKHVLKGTPDPDAGDDDKQTHGKKDPP